MRRSANVVGVGSERSSKVWIVPPFSATNTRPFGAISASIGSFSPVIAVVRSKPGGSVSAPAAGRPGGEHGNADRENRDPESERSGRRAGRRGGGAKISVQR